MEEEEQIKQEIRQWSLEVLEIPSDTFNGLPPCPYARKAWKQNKVRVHVAEEISKALEVKEACPDDDSVDVIAWTGYESMEVDDFDLWIDRQNEDHGGIWMIGFHPDHPVDDLLEEFEGNGAPEYGLILIQSLRHLSKSSQSIFKRGYYNNYSPSDIKTTQRRNIKWQEVA